MPGLVAASWSQARNDDAARRFEQVCEAYTRVKGVPRSDLQRVGEFAVARFAIEGSLSPDVHRDPEHERILAAAGWWFDRNAREDECPLLPLLASRYAGRLDELADALDGQFLMVAVDARTNCLLAAGDRANLLPWYVAREDGVSWISTSAMALACVLRPKLDLLGIGSLLMGSSIRGPRSAFEGVRRISPGQRAVLADGRLTLEHAWRDLARPRAYRSIRAAAQEGLQIARHTCRRIYHTFDRPICDLTSGLDTRLVASVITGEKLPFHATVGGIPENIDVVIARRIAAQCGFPIIHTTRPDDWGGQRWPFFSEGIRLADGEMPGPGIEGTIRTKRMMQNEFSVALSGSGGELFREFPWEHIIFKRGRTTHVDVASYARYRLLPWYRTDLNLFDRDWQEDWARDQIRSMQTLVDLIPDALNTAKLDLVYLWRSSGHFARYYGAAWHVIPSAMPLMTGEMLDFALGVPPRYRNRANLLRHIVALANPVMAGMPTCWGGSARPMGIAHPIRSFPYGVATAKRWLRKLASVTIRKSIFPDPVMLKRPNPRHDLDFLPVLERENLLSLDAYRTADLYNADGIHRLFERARNGDMGAFKMLYIVASIELTCRTCELEPRGQSF
jgi:asparagine synthetase B (glutamine-hydrolysing)